jgi:iron complex transport system permease protein
MAAALPRSPLLTTALLALVACALPSWALLGNLPDGPQAGDILWQLRLPRMLLALMAGAALALAGLWLQTLFRHALVEPGLLGVTSGAGLMAVLSLLVWQGAAWLMPLGAFAGAGLALLTVLALARRYQLQAESLLLVGIALNALLAAGTQLLLILSPDATLRAGSFWLMGSFAYAEWRWLLPSLLVLLLALFWGMRRAASFDLWLLGEREAGHLGLPVARFRRQVIWGSAALVALAVAQAGSVAFIGLMAPHIASRWAGCHHARLMPAVVLVGGLLAVFADTLARTLLSPLELPVGIMTALLGAPFFLAVLHLRWQR